MVKSKSSAKSPSNKKKTVYFSKSIFKSRDIQEILETLNKNSSNRDDVIILKEYVSNTIIVEMANIQYTGLYYLHQQIDNNNMIILISFYYYFEVNYNNLNKEILFDKNVRPLHRNCLLYDLSNKCDPVILIKILFNHFIKYNKLIQKFYKFLTEEVYYQNIDFTYKNEYNNEYNIYNIDNKAVKIFLELILDFIAFQCVNNIETNFNIAFSRIFLDLFSKYHDYISPSNYLPIAPYR